MLSVSAGWNTPLGTDTEGIDLSPAYQYSRQYTKFHYHSSISQKFTQNHHEKDNPVYIYRTFLTRRIGTMETGRRQVKNCLG